MSTEATRMVVSHLIQRLTTRWFALNQQGAQRAQAAAPREPRKTAVTPNEFAYAVEPKIPIRNSREARALILAIVEEGFQGLDAWYQILEAYQERIWKLNEPVYIKLKIALQFLLDRRFNASSPIKEAVKAVLRFHPRSYFGNDLRIAAEVLRRIGYRIRALQRSKIKRCGIPKRPREQAKPAHAWLPSWERQYQPWFDNFGEEEPPIWELLSPTEALLHFGRNRR